MKYAFYLLFAFLFLSACNSSVDEDETTASADRQKIRISVPSYGIWGKGDDDDIYDSPSDLVQETDSIQLKLGRIFGIKYQITSTPNTDKSITLQTVWIKPHTWYDEDYEDDIDRISENVYPSYSHYGFIQHTIAEDDLHQKGRWQLQVYYGARLLYRKNFFLK